MLKSVWCTAKRFPASRCQNLGVFQLIELPGQFGKEGRGGCVARLFAIEFTIQDVGESAGVAAAETAWRGDGLASLPERLDAANGMPLRVADIPNGRLSEVHTRVAAALGDDFEPGASWIDPRPVRYGRPASGSFRISQYVGDHPSLAARCTMSLTCVSAEVKA